MTIALSPDLRPVPPGAESLFFGNTRVSFLAAVSAGHGFTVIEHVMPYGESPPLHVHETEDEFFLVLEGRMRFRTGEGTRDIAAGGTLFAPKGRPHTFRVMSPEGARCLTVTLGTDFEALVRALSRPATTPGLPPFEAMGPEAIFALGRACARHRIRVVGAPMA